MFNNVSFYKTIFIENGVIAFKNANLSHEDHLKIHDILGKELNSYRENSPEGYTENHSRLYNDDINRPSGDEIMLDWHIEHPHYSNPIVLGTWNMHKFVTNSENGKTYFVDNKLLYEQMPTSFKEFSKKCKIINPVGKNQGVSGEHELIQKHWITKEPVIRISHMSKKINTEIQTIQLNNFQKLYKFEDRDPNKDEYESYFEIMQWIQDQLYNNLNIRIVHKWDQGDLVIPDMYRMCHAVTGGFKPQDREFTGIWGRQYKHDIESGSTI